MSKQEDLRRLMKEKRENKKEPKIKSPFAKYDCSGNLHCVVCAVQIRNGVLWYSHVAGKVHKENASQQKRKFLDKEENLIANKKPKGQSETAAEGKLEKEENVVVPQIDDPIAPKLDEVQTLPEGFFDDPVLDAKARKIEYKDPIEEEWERYQRAIAEETNVSKNIMEEDLEESVLERDIAQIDEQIVHWRKVKELETLAEEVKVTAPSKMNEEDDSNSDVELDEDDLLDWRTKSVAKR